VPTARGTVGGPGRGPPRGCALVMVQPARAGRKLARGRPCRRRKARRRCVRFGGYGFDTSLERHSLVLDKRGHAPESSESTPRPAGWGPAGPPGIVGLVAGRGRALITATEDDESRIRHGYEKRLIVRTCFSLVMHFTRENWRFRGNRDLLRVNSQQCLTGAWWDDVVRMIPSRGEAEVGQGGTAVLCLGAER
jgi:hypothetical protein